MKVFFTIAGLMIWGLACYGLMAAAGAYFASDSPYMAVMCIVLGVFSFTGFGLTLYKILSSEVMR